MRLPLTGPSFAVKVTLPWKAPLSRVAAIMSCRGGAEAGQLKACLMDA